MDYHDYVIRDGHFVGKFEEMYKNCEDPWPESESDYENLPTSSYLPVLLRRCRAQSVFSLGSGTGQHLNWLSRKVPGVLFRGSDVSETAVKISRRRFPELNVTVASVKDFVRDIPQFDVLVLREILWYVLDDLEALVQSLVSNAKGTFVAVELSTYEDQKYGLEFFAGPESLIEKFPLPVVEHVRYHPSRSKSGGHILLWCEV